MLQVDSENKDCILLISEKRLQSAARDVAHSLGSDEKRVESELLSKLLNVSSKSNTDAAATLRYYNK